MSFDQRTVTEKRLAANRAAAQKSTGPKSPEGQRWSSLNSFQHGAFAAEGRVLSDVATRAGADSAALAARRQELLDAWRPDGAQQTLLVDDLVWLYWLRDHSRQALVESQARALPRAELDRDQRRFNARSRPPSLNSLDFDETPLVSLPASQAKFIWAAAFLADLEEWASRGRWSGNKPGGSGYPPESVLKFLFSRVVGTLRGQKVLRLWWACAEKHARSDDPRVQEILALLAEERAAFAEEEQLFHRQEELDIERPESVDWPALQPLGETWQRLVLAVERLDRQINAKVRLLIRLQQHADKMTAPGARSAKTAELSRRGVATPALPAGSDAGTDRRDDPVAATPPSPEDAVAGGPAAASPAPAPGARAKIRGTKPSEPLESATEPIEVASYGSQPDGPPRPAVVCAPDPPAEAR